MRRSCALSTARLREHVKTRDHPISTCAQYVTGKHVKTHQPCPETGYRYFSQLTRKASVSDEADWLRRLTAVHEGVPTIIAVGVHTVIPAAVPLSYLQAYPPAVLGPQPLSYHRRTTAIPEGVAVCEVGGVETQNAARDGVLPESDGAARGVQTQPVRACAETTT